MFFLSASENRKISDLEAVYLDSPDALVHLETSDEYFCKRYTNLEVLRTHFLNKKILADFERLKTLEIIGESSEKRVSDVHRKAVKYLVKQSKVLKRPNFKLFYYGVPMVNGTELDEMSYHLELQIENYRLLNDDLSYVSEIDYSHLQRLLLSNQFGELPSGFFSTFFNIQKVTTSRLVIKKSFFNFLRKSIYLTDLELINSSLAEALVDLPQVCNLKNFKVTEIAFTDVNFDFILGFSRLQSFECFVTCPFSFHSLAILSFQKLTELVAFKFKKTLYGQLFDIQKRNGYSIKTFSSTGLRITVDHVEDLENLVEHCVRAKYNKLDQSVWASEILYLGKFYKQRSIDRHHSYD